MITDNSAAVMATSHPSLLGRHVLRDKRSNDPAESWASSAVAGTTGPGGLLAVREAVSIAPRHAFLLRPYGAR